MVNADYTITLDKAEKIIGPYDFHAVEAALQIKESTQNTQDVELCVLTAGGRCVGDAKLKKAIL